ncbi:GAF and ANTAR domain-containing protein [Nocardioides plantarum]|uniref:GAF and ANTAR domain-containing protein n=1 Tax=Nocardioides plantarum TaxID=29299 RepID=A0ABV5KED2_9ACTN|nr:GAF and ANTAR domain-containing protein [Nocardioides plantarum]
MPSYPHVEVLTAAAAKLSSALSLDDTLRVVVQTALDALPAIDHAAVTLVAEDEKWSTSSASDDVALQLDSIQYELRQGPCVDALLDPRTAVVELENARHDPRWHDYLVRAVRLGLRSQLALTLRLGDRTVGGLNLYSTSSDRIGDHTRELAPLLATHATLAISHARQVENLYRAIESRSTIGQAVGLTMKEYGINSEAAFQFLMRLSSSTERKLRDVAADIVAVADEIG